MTFSEEQIELLKEKLDPSHVAARKQSGITLDYIEGYHAIDEANRISGFDGWSYHVEIVNRVEEDITIGAKQAKGKHVGVVAKVYVIVGDVSREDVGFGTGRSTSAVDANELAYKEAVTDALKRALRTFGNQFGNALYDKKRRGVASTSPNKAPQKASKASRGSKAPSKAKASPETTSSKDFKAMIKELETEEELMNFRKEYRDEIKAQEDSKEIVQFFNERRKEVA